MSATIVDEVTHEFVFDYPFLARGISRVRHDGRFSLPLLYAQRSRSGVRRARAGDLRNAAGRVGAPRIT